VAEPGVMMAWRSIPRNAGLSWLTDAGFVELRLVNAGGLPI